MKVLVTGGCGFVGANFVRLLLSTPEHAVVNLDKLTYAGSRERLSDVEWHERYRFVHGSINDAALVGELVKDCDAVVNLAAESHVDRSIRDASAFVETNVGGVRILLDALRETPGGTDMPFVQVSTDEVFGDLPLDRPELKFNEASPFAPSSPYAASKAGGDLLAKAYHRTHGLDVRVTHCTNNLGPWQHPEKLVPRFITNLLRGQRVPLYGDGDNVRDWMYVADHCMALLAVLEKGRPGASYCIGAENERSNRELTQTLLEIMGLDESRIEPVPDRPGHDHRYGVDPRKARDELGWTPTRSGWPATLAEAVAWYRGHEAWWERLLDGPKL